MRDKKGKNLGKRVSTDDQSGEDNSPSRRDILRGAGAFGAAAVSVGAISSTAAGHEEPIEDVKRPGWVKRQQLLAQAISDKRSRKIIRAMIDDGFTPKLGDVLTSESTLDGDNWHTVVIPFKDGNPGKKDPTYLFWTDHDLYDNQVAGFHVVHKEPDGGEAYWEETSYLLQDGEVVTTQNTKLNFLGCSNLNWGCILLMAGTYGATISACGTCAASSGWLVWACATCISRILASGGVTILCDWCKD